jgi:D-cysteine desulfhydrase
MANPLAIESPQRPLLERFPGLKRLPFVPLMDGIPTPVQRLERLSAEYPGFDVWIKRDDICSSIYGGNKPRKFEFLLADALAKKKNKIITAGGTGTNHGLATVLFAKALGLKSKIYMFDQPLTWGVQKKLLMYLGLDTEIELVHGYGHLLFKGLYNAMFHPRTFMMLPGGSPLFGIGSVLGCIGFVNAGFELKEQIDAGAMPEPDYIYIAAGSTGSSSGLILGCHLAGLKTKVVAVQVSDGTITNPASIERNIKKTSSVLHKLDPAIPVASLVHDRDFLFVSGYLGSKYACVTKSGLQAVDKVAEFEGDLGFHLETTYTGKACAAMLDFMADPEHKGPATILFWNTYNSKDLTELAKGFEYQKLPRALRKYFDTRLTCWQNKSCPDEVREVCPAYFNDDNRCWNVMAKAGEDTSECDACPAKKAIEENSPIENA